jgi:hypothetical protein
VLRARSLEVTACSLHISRNLRFQLFNRAELSLVTKAIQKSNAHNIAVKITVPVHYEGLNRRFRSISKRRPNPNIRNATAPLPFDQCPRDVNAIPGYDAVMGVQVGRWKTQRVTAFRATLNASFNTVRTAQHASRLVHLTGSQ